MIRSFRHKGIQTYFLTGKMQGIQANHAPRLRLQLAMLDKAQGSNDMAVIGWKLHPLKGKLANLLGGVDKR